MIVYVAEKGCYEDRDIAGIYKTPEAAIAANPIPANPRRLGRAEPGWKKTGEATWTNGCDWADAMSIDAYEVGA